jgi:hypothetical protein
MSASALRLPNRYVIFGKRGQQSRLLAEQFRTRQLQCQSSTPDSSFVSLNQDNPHLLANKGMSRCKGASVDKFIGTAFNYADFLLHAEGAAPEEIASASISCRLRNVMGSLLVNDNFLCLWMCLSALTTLVVALVASLIR